MKIESFESLIHSRSLTCWLYLDFVTPKVGVWKDGGYGSLYSLNGGR